MTQEYKTVAPPAEQSVAPKEPLLPDGVGLTLEQAKALLAKHNKILLSRDDEPALMGITLCNAYLAELEKLHARHENGLTRLMGEKTDAYVAGIQAGVAQLSKSLSSASVEGIRKVFDDHAARLNAFKNSTAWLAAIVAISALVNVAVFVLKAVR